MDETQKSTDQIIKELNQMFPNFNFIFLIWENGSSAVNIASNLPDANARQALKDIGSHLHVIDKFPKFKG